jgi:hypothetical protein
MSARFRHCIECPNCHIRYLIGFSPYGNGSYVIPSIAGSTDEWTLYCSCEQPPIPTRRWSHSLEVYAVSNQAHYCGYGSPEQIVQMGKDQSSSISGEPIRFR